MTEETAKVAPNKNGRIAILDSFRAIAIIAVILYHYFYKWNDLVQPYLGSSFFHQGFKGVPFFFIISGFVIYNTLEHTSSIILFWKKRFIRLFPSILIASILTFVFLKLFDDKYMFSDSHHFRNFLVSLTFLPPNLFDWILGTKNYYSYLNSDYWSLWPEIQFYLFSSFLYFFNKEKFNKNFITLSFIIIILYNLTLFFNLDKVLYIEKLFNLFNIIKYLPFFLSGILFYLIYNKSNNETLYILLIVTVFVLLNYPFSTIDFTFYLIMFLLFFCFIFAPQVLRILEKKLIVTIGISSYFLYLIHDYIGTICIKKIVCFFYPYSFIAPLLIFILMIIFSVFYTKYIELHISKFFKNKILPKNNNN